MVAEGERLYNTEQQIVLKGGTMTRKSVVNMPQGNTGNEIE